MGDCHARVPSGIVSFDSPVTRLSQLAARLPTADVRMAKELGFKPRSPLKNQPSPQQPWKAPVAELVRDLYAKRERRSEQRRQRRERGQEARVDLTNADPSVATPTKPADI